MRDRGDIAKQPTIKDVARVAGVSKTTVSRFLGGEIESLAEDTYKKIERAIQELDYRPNKMARGLKGRRSYLIGVIVADITNPFSTAILRGAEDICQQNEYSLLVCNSDNDAEKERNYIFMLQSHQIDGLIINTTGQNSAMLLEMQQNNTPIVLLDREVPDMDVDLVTVDNEQATRHALDYLVRQGYSEIAYVTQPIAGVSTRTERVKTFWSYMRQVGLEDNASVHELNIEDDEMVEATLRAFMEQPKTGPRAIFAGNSVTLLKVGLELQRQGYDVPIDIGMIGFDNPEWAQMIRTSSVAQPTYAMGVKAMECLLERMRGDLSGSKTIRLPAELIIRHSTDREGDIVG